MNESAPGAGAEALERHGPGPGPVYAATTSEGVLAPVQVVRKIKPPSATFLQGGKNVETDGSSKAEAKEMSDPPAQVGEELFASPAPETPVAAQDAPDAASSAADAELSGPAPVASTAVPETLSGAAPTAPEMAAATAASEAASGPATDLAAQMRAQQSYSQERLMAELRELDDIVSGLESLKFLKPRLTRSLEEGADAMTLVSFYRLAARALKDEAGASKTTTEQLRREFESARSKASKLELELATAMANPGSGGSASGSLTLGDHGGGSSDSRTAALEAELSQVNAQREKLLVDFRNMRDRTQRELDLKIFKEKERFFQSFLPVLDSFERAQQTMNESSGVPTLLEGFRMISIQLSEALEREGLESVDTDGHFDPRFHEAVGEVETQEKHDEYVYDELSRGYKLGERLIRPAMVRVARNRSGVVISKNQPEEAVEEPKSETATEE